MALSTTPTGDLRFSQVATVSGLPGAEISAYDAGSKKLFTTSGNGVSVIDLTNPSSPSVLSTINFVTTYGALSNDIQSVATKGGNVAVAVRNLDKTMPGEVVIFNASTGALVQKVTVGANPDMLTFTADGSKVLVANEGELRSSSSVGPADTDGVTDSNIDPEGSVSIVAVATGAVQTAGFTSFNGQEQALRDQGVRIFPGKTVAQDVEPEYIALSPDGSKAFVTLQEANAIAILDVATATFTSIVPLGIKQFVGEYDFNDQDGKSLKTYNANDATKGTSE